MVESTAPNSCAAFGIPNTTDEGSSWAKVAAPARRSSSSPRAPSRPMPVRSAAAALAPAARATDVKSTSIDGAKEFTLEVRASRGDQQDPGHQHISGAGLARPEAGEPAQPFGERGGEPGRHVLCHQDGGRNGGQGPP